MNPDPRQLGRAIGEHVHNEGSRCRAISGQLSIRLGNGILRYYRPNNLSIIPDRNALPEVLHQMLQFAIQSGTESNEYIQIFDS